MNKNSHDDGGGLMRDMAALSKLIERRKMLRLLAGASLVPLLGACPGEEDLGEDNGAGGPRDSGASNGSDAGVGGSGSSNAGSCTKIPEETAGPYPGDGSNGANVLSVAGVVRKDIRPSFGTLSGTAVGVPLEIELTLMDASACKPLAGYAVYLWHCDRDGNYSLYTVTTQNYLRGIQASDDAGKVTFTSIFPACYSGRWPHIHFEVYAGLDKAMAVGNKLATSQLALPIEACNAVFASEGYSKSVSNLAQISLNSDNVFSDGTSQQLAAVSGSVSAGYTAKLTLGVKTG